MSRTIDIDRVHKMARPIWKKNFRLIMSYDSYFEQILRYNIFPYMLSKNKIDKKLFMNYKNKTIQMTLQAIGKQKELGIGRQFEMDYEEGN